jgi:hypothetical protein
MFRAKFLSTAQILAAEHEMWKVNELAGKFQAERRKGAAGQRERSKC